MKLKVITGLMMMLFLTSIIPIPRVQASPSITIPFSDIEPDLDGDILTDEWADATGISFTGIEDVVNFYIKYIPETNWIYVAFEVSDTDGNENDFVEIDIDFDHNGGIAPRVGDYYFAVTRTGLTYTGEGNGTDWVTNPYPAGWSSAVMTTAPGYSVEIRIQANVVDNQEMGILLLQTDYWIEDETLWYNQGSYPSSATNSPTTWEDIVFLKQSIDEIFIQLESTVVGEEATLTLTISPPLSTGTVTFHTSRNGGPWTDIASGTLIDGNCTSTWIPTEPGEYRCKALWSGNHLYSQMESSILTQRIKEITSIEVIIASNKIKKEDTLDVSGSITPAVSGATIILTYMKDNVVVAEHMVITDASGSFSDETFSSDETGSYTLQASWEGDENHVPVSVSGLQFEIEACIIATSTYGSYLAPEVQFLRSFRQQVVYSTFAGSQFMEIFNAWYYSFSPTVAGFIVDNPAIKPVMRDVLYPLLRVLHLARTTYEVFSFNSEVGIVMAGLVASSLIGIIYFLPFALLFSLVKKVKVFAKMIRMTGLVWVGSVLAIVVAEVTKSPLIMMTSTGIFVLATISATTLAFTKIISDSVMRN